jgi:hypothetical protein
MHDTEARSYGIVDMTTAATGLIVYTAIGEYSLTAPRSTKHSAGRTRAGSPCRSLPREPAYRSVDSLSLQACRCGPGAFCAAPCSSGRCVKRLPGSSCKTRDRVGGHSFVALLTQLAQERLEILESAKPFREVVPAGIRLTLLAVDADHFLCTPVYPPHGMPQFVHGPVGRDIDHASRRSV